MNEKVRLHCLDVFQVSRCMAIARVYICVSEFRMQLELACATSRIFTILGNVPTRMFVFCLLFFFWGGGRYFADAQSVGLIHMEHS